MKLTGGLAVIGLMLATSSCASPTSSMPEATPTVTVTITASPESESPQATESFGPWPGDNRFVDGIWPVGIAGSIPGPGILMSGQVIDCRWFLHDKGGKLAEKGIASPSDYTVMVTVEEGDTFESSGCNYWQYADVSEPAGPIEEDYAGRAGTYKDLGDPVFPGTWKVGTQIPAGAYFLQPSSQDRNCKFSVKKYDAWLGYIPLIEYEWMSETGRVVRSQIMHLKKGQLFETSGCGVWVRQVWEEE